MDSLSEVNLAGHAHAFEKYLEQHYEAVCAELPHRKLVFYKPENKHSKYHKLLIANLIKYLLNASR